MKIEAYPLQSSERQSPDDKIKGYVEMPEGAKIIHVGAVPPNGEMVGLCEVSPMNLPMQKIDVTILRQGDDIPRGYAYLSYILAVPILFVYKRKDNAIIT